MSTETGDLVKGQRVCLSEEGRKCCPRKTDRQGVVCRARQTPYGKIVTVLWDGLKSTTSYAARFLQPIGADDAPLPLEVLQRFAHVEWDCGELIDEIMKADDMASRCFQSAQDAMKSDPEGAKRLVDLGFHGVRRASVLRSQFNGV